MKKNQYASKNPSYEIYIVFFIGNLLVLLFHQSIYHKDILPLYIKSSYLEIIRYTTSIFTPFFLYLVTAFYILCSQALVITMDYDKKSESLEKIIRKKKGLFRPTFNILLFLFSVSYLFLSLYLYNYILYLYLLAIGIVYLYRDIVFDIIKVFPSSRPILSYIYNLEQDQEKSIEGYDTLQKREQIINRKIIGLTEKANLLQFTHRLGKDNILINNNPRRGNLIVGSSGAGKSFSILNPMIIQTIKNLKIPMVLYDFKFNSNDNQTKIALKTFLEAHKEDKGYPVKEFHLTTFSEEYLHNISRINPICSNTIISEFHANSFMKIFFSSMDKQWIKNPDFWAKSVFAYTAAVVLAHKKHKPDFTLAHILHFLSIDYEKQVKTLIAINDPQINAKIEMIRKPVISERGGDQLSGIFSTMQNFISELHNHNFFFAISKEEVSLHVNNKDKPVFLSIGNDNLFKPVFSPLISMYCAIIFALCNREGNLPLHFMADEAPTLYLPGVDDFINTGRGNNMMTTLGIQGYAQNIYSYGSELARVLQGSLSNTYAGQINDEGAQSSLSKMMGNYKRKVTNKSKNQGKISKSESEIQEPLMRYEEISGLPQGYFFGKVAEGKTTRFMGQVDVSEYIPTMETANSLPYPLNNTVKTLYKKGYVADKEKITKEDINDYYKGDKKSNNKINRIVNAYAKEVYDSIIEEENEFIDYYYGIYEEAEKHKQLLRKQQDPEDDI